MFRTPKNPGAPMKPTVFLILMALGERERHGYGLVKVIESHAPGTPRRAREPLPDASRDEARGADRRIQAKARPRARRLPTTLFPDHREGSPSRPRGGGAAFEARSHAREAQARRELTWSGESRFSKPFYRPCSCSFPAPFRKEYGEDLLQLFRDRRGELGASSPPRSGEFWTRCFADLVLEAAAERARTDAEPRAAGREREEAA